MKTNLNCHRKDMLNQLGDINDLCIDLLIYSRYKKAD